MKKGMVKVSVMYPNGDGKHFDMDYYLSKHIPLVGELLGEKLKETTVDKGIGSIEPGSNAPYACMGIMYFETAEDFGTSFGPNASKILGDLPNFTNIKPDVQISEVMI